MQKLKITNKSADEIKSLIKSKESYQIGSRLVSILPLAMGQSSRKAQELLLLSHNQICIWAKRFEKNGIDGLKDLPKSGRKSRIDDKQLSWLEQVVLNESPTKYKFNTETWTAPLLVKVLFTECNLTYSDDAVYILLKKKLGLTHKKGKGFYREGDIEKRTVFVEDLKKTLRKSK
jgi:transposase